MNSLPALAEDGIYHVDGASLAVWLGLNVSTIRSLLAENKVSVKGGGYDFLKAVPALVSYYREQAQKTSKTKADASARREDAEADRAEMARDKEAGVLVDAEDMKRTLEQVVIGTREKVRRLPGLTLDQKKAVTEIIAEMKLPLPGEK